VNRLCSLLDNNNHTILYCLLFLLIVYIKLHVSAPIKSHGSLQEPKYLA
jgi:hypothetical protein